ncbi:hypothetical protein RRG08_042360 [Elysia crispata]|uniref:Antistasin-like domain-containing protein n=1 Tax=Elysia crispata TaxID=231223 RepID=A0AAE0ZBT5_9GAST|nr:hypothetical protein RRG08_042360 [Elysia crispata]
MKVVFAFAVFLLAAAAVEEKRQLVGICVEECSMALSDSTIMAALGVKQQCPDGHVCKSNGCGHTCQPVTKTTIPTKSQCSGVMCAMFCIDGFQLGPDGCPICRCATKPLPTLVVS